jgi:general L-amino acid transport system permease protein
MRAAAPSGPLPPPVARRLGALGWARAHLFAGWASSLTTVAVIAGVAWLAPDILRYLVFDAVWRAPDGAACRAPGAGACWAFIFEKTPFFVYGSYPPGQRWRVDLTMLVGAALIGWSLWRGAPRKGLAALLLLVVYPPIAFALLYGAPFLGLAIVPTSLWGGVFVSFLVAAVGIVFSLPFGVLLALGRRSRLPVVRAMSVGFHRIRARRAAHLRAVHGQCHAAAVRAGGLGAGPAAAAADRRGAVRLRLYGGSGARRLAGDAEAGSSEAARWRSDWAGGARSAMWSLPQALTLVIPGIVNTFIGLFKDTTLVAAVGALDFLRAVDVARQDPEWSGPTIALTSYIFAGLFYFVACFGHVALFARGGARSFARPTPVEDADHARPSRSPASRRDARRAQMVRRLPRLARDVDLDVARREDRHLRAVGLRQVDPDPLHQPAGASTSRGASPSTASN